jgi:hypothetical protein
MAKVPKAKTPNPLVHARDHVGSYAAALWPPFELPPHLRLLSGHLEAAERGEIDRLMVFMPPRHGKSVLASTLYPAWYLGRHPDRSIITSSYS